MGHGIEKIILLLLAQLSAIFNIQGLPRETILKWIHLCASLINSLPQKSFDFLLEGIQFAVFYDTPLFRLNKLSSRSASMTLEFYWITSN
jgi:hypothetical protein